MSCNPVILIILDGWGQADISRWNAISNANTPAWDRLWKEYPRTLIDASGTAVGLPDRQMGNSEVGHMNIGSGRVIDQDFTRITRAIEDGSLAKNEVLLQALDTLKKTGGTLHVMGLLSPGGVHSHQEHIFALLGLANELSDANVCLHAFLDGRDTAPQSASEYLLTSKEKLSTFERCRIASVCGRYYAMDRNQNWDRTGAAYELIVDGTAEFNSTDAIAALDAAYARGETDEFVKPTLITDENGQSHQVSDGDVVIFANYRADRARQLSMAFAMNDFKSFERKRRVALSAFVSLTQYKSDFDFPVIFPPQKHSNVFGEYVANLGLRQLRIAETEKYAHVTFFFNGGEERVFDNEDRILVPSPHVATYDLQPEMNAMEVAENMVEAINRGSYDAIICNFANADMVGHTGNYEAAVKAIESLDVCLDMIQKAARESGAEILITADHGNAEQMREQVNGEEQPHTAHTNNLVPLVYVGRPAEVVNENAALCDLAPSMLYLMGVGQPAEMTGRPIFAVANDEATD